MGQDIKRDSGICDIVSAFAARTDTNVDQIVDLFGRLHVQYPERSGAAGSGHAALSDREDQVTCLVCGKGFKMLKRHLRTAHDLSEMEYRMRFGLPEGRPLVAPEYSRLKAEQAREAGLGQRPRTRPA